MVARTFEELVRFQIESDSRNGFENNRPGNLDDLSYSSIALSGEVGEFLNDLKKILRTEKYGKIREGEAVEKLKAGLKSELGDVLAYWLKLAYLLEFDVEKDYVEKINNLGKRYKA